MAGSLKLDDYNDDNEDDEKNYDKIFIYYQAAITDYYCDWNSNFLVSQSYGKIVSWPG